MAQFLFIDESGNDMIEKPYAVLAGLTVKDSNLWDWIQDLQDAEIKHFGRRYSEGPSEIKGRKFLNKKVFRLANQLSGIPLAECSDLAKSCLDNGGTAGKKELTALAQAKLEYVREAIDICRKYDCRAFASVVNAASEIPDSKTFLRKDYAYLLERFYYYLEDRGISEFGIIVFDELEKSRSHILVGQLDKYFKLTLKGLARSKQIIPEPFFVHSDLTTGIQIVDLIAYIICWGWKQKDADLSRNELKEFANKAFSLRYKTKRILEGQEREIWSFTYIDDLRPTK